MKLYAFSLPTVPEKQNWLKIGQTTGSVEDRVRAETSQVNLPYHIAWQDTGLIGKREITDHILHAELESRGFQRDGRSEWFKCFVPDVAAALDAVKQRYINEDKRSQLSEEFYERLRNWYYWAVEESNDGEYTLRIIVRLLLCFFLREKGLKGLIPVELFDKRFVDENLKENEYRYYKAILRNLFFYSLNTPVPQRGELENRNLIEHYNKVKEMLHKRIPFLNGGLFNEHHNDNFALNDDYFFSEKRSRILTALADKHTRFQVEGLVRILASYQYTLDETDDSELIDPEFIGRIFESLLACIDADSHVNRRKITGSYYTPKEIVDYMVNESLNAYLTAGNFNDKENALLRCRILDPACGSGAFPCGVMNVMMKRLDPNKILTQAERYQKKLEILRNVIYGIDIQPMAVQISIFRIFLSLVQELQPTKNAKDNFGIEPLPNLDYKFVCADTLRSVEGNGIFFSEHREKFEQIKLLKFDYFNENSIAAKERLRQRLVSIEQEILANFQDEMNSFDKQIHLLETEWHSETNAATKAGLKKRLKNVQDRRRKMINAEAVVALCRWNHSDTKPSPYFDSRWMFGIDKFDIVIGNPPYVGEDRHKKIFAPYKQSPFYMGKMDLFYFFFHTGLDILAEGGTLALISTNYYLMADGALKLRQDIFKRAEVRELINFNEHKIFESALGQHNVITLLRRTNSPKDTVTKQTLVHRKGNPDGAITNSILEKQSDDAVYQTIYRKKLFDGENLYIRFASGNGIDSVLNKIAKAGTVLGRHFMTHQGVVPGAMVFTKQHHRKYLKIKAETGSPIFIFPKGDLEKMAGEKAEYMKPFFKNSDIHRYIAARKTNKELLYADGSIELPQSILSYLKKFLPILKQRRECKEGKINWWELQWARTEDLFTRPKIVLPYRCKRATFAYCDFPFYAATDVYYISEENNNTDTLKALLGILNSKLIHTWLYYRGKRKGEILELFSTPLQQIPIPKISLSEQQPLVKLVEKRISGDKKVEAEIDQLVYQLYGLTDEEIKLVEKRNST